jgi:hypothetical protein
MPLRCNYGENSGFWGLLARFLGFFRIFRVILNENLEHKTPIFGPNTGFKVLLA